MIKLTLTIKETGKNELEMKVDEKGIFATENERITVEEIKKRLKVDEKEQKIFNKKLNEDQIKEIIELLNSI